MSQIAASIPSRRPWQHSVQAVLRSPVTVRIATGLLVLWAAITLSFLAVQLAPGDIVDVLIGEQPSTCLLYTSPSPRDLSTSRMPSSA